MAGSPCCKAGINMTGFNIGNGDYSLLLGVNVISAICCWGMAALALLDNRKGADLADRHDDDGEGDVDAKNAGLKAADGGKLPAIEHSRAVDHVDPASKDAAV